MTTTVSGATRYRWPRALVLRPVGMLLGGLGLTWIAGAVIAHSVNADTVHGGASGAGSGSSVRLLALATTVVVIAAASWLVTRPPLVLELSEQGYRLHHLRGGGAVAAGWREVESAQTRDTADGAALVIELSDGRRSVVPLTLLGSRAGRAAREVHDLLDTAYGYRRLSG